MKTRANDPGSLPKAQRALLQRVRKTLRRVKQQLRERGAWDPPECRTWIADLPLTRAQNDALEALLDSVLGPDQDPVAKDGLDAHTAEK